MEKEILDLGEILRNNEYPGRGILIGKSPDGTKALCAYFIMGRSENSRNRIFVRDGKGIRTEAFDPSKLSDPSLIIYSPVRVLGQKIIVSNGDQTDTIYDFLSEGKSFEEALETRCFEPDEPNWTPRISGLLDLEDGFSYKLSILKSGDPEGKSCERLNINYAPENGVGHFIHTYDGNGDPLPSFSGEPIAVKTDNFIDGLCKTIWYNLNEENKVSLFVRYTDLETGRTESRSLNKNF
ncbi:MAG: inosine monophosphate cyclohydrolase [Clostridiales bacterium]|jgi:IMP cyclohydrolase|nr:inosine monophosphate cyclohydrolase [Clostridiales bacterium]